MYHPHTPYLQAQTRNHVSYGWRSIQVGKDLLNQGLRVRLGNGRNTRIWSDPWLPTLPLRPAFGHVLDINMTVADLWQEGKRDWDPIVFEGALNPTDQRLAKCLYLSKHAEDDSYEWAYTRNVEYSVRSGYWVATHVDIHDERLQKPPEGSVALKKEIWAMDIAPKIKHFLWRSLAGALATIVQLRTRSIPADPVCQRCCQGDETINHILFTCSYAQAVWRSANLHFAHNRFSDDFEVNINQILKSSKTQGIPISQRLLPIWITWRLWKSRNDFLFRKINRLPIDEVNKGRTEAKEWIEANTKEEEVLHYSTDHIPNQTRSTQWCPPPCGWLKCNFDSGFVKERPYTTTCWVIRDSNGQVILAGCAQLPPSTSSLQAEALGFLHALQVTWAHGLKYVWFEGDNLELTILFNTCSDHSSLGTLLYDIRHWMFKFPEASLGHINRERNAAADTLARHASSIHYKKTVK